MIFEISLLLYAVGSNYQGELGVGDQQRKLIFTKVEGLKSANIKQIAQGDYFSLFLDKNGIVYSTGDNSYGQLGLNSSVKNASKPTKIDYFTHSNITIVQIAAGYRHSLALSSDGRKLYSFGDNEHYQLGGQFNNVYLPNLVYLSNLQQNEQIIQIESRANYNYLKTNKGNWYAWGHDGINYIFPGKSNNTTILIPTRMYMPFEVKLIHLGVQNIWITNLSNYLFAMGTNRQDMICNDTRSPYLTEFTQLNRNQITKIVTGNDHTIILSNNVASGCGIGYQGQLGNVTNSSTHYETIISKGLGQVLDIAATGNGTFLLTKNGLFSSGMNFHGEMSVNSTSIQYSFVPTVYSSNIIPQQIITNGNYYSFLLATDENEEEEQENKKPSNKLSGEAIALIVVSILFAAILITNIVFFVVKKIKSKDGVQKRWLLEGTQEGIAYENGN